MGKQYYVGVDIGGTHISAAGAITAAGPVLENTFFRQPVNAGGTAAEILSGWAGLIQRTINALPPGQLVGIGIAMPGPFDYEEGRSLMKDQDKFDALYGLNIRQELLQRLELPDPAPLVFENDAICFALGESAHGAARLHRRLILLTLGTGLGAAFVQDNRPLCSGPGVPPGGTLYNVPFREGIAEDYLSTRWFVKAYRELTQQEVAGVKDLSQAARQGNATAASLFTTFGHTLGALLTPWISAFGASAVVLGGNISKAAAQFLPALQQELEDTEIILSTMDEQAPILGAVTAAQKKRNFPFYTN